MLAPGQGMCLPLWKEQRQEKGEKAVRELEGGKNQKPKKIYLKKLVTNCRFREFPKIYPPWLQNGHCCSAPTFVQPQKGNAVLGLVIPIDFLDKVSYPGGASSPQSDICRDHRSALAFSGCNEIWETMEEPARRPSGRKGSLKRIMLIRVAFSLHLFGCYSGQN